MKTIILLILAFILVFGLNIQAQTKKNYNSLYHYKTPNIKS